MQIHMNKIRQFTAFEKAMRYYVLDADNNLVDATNNLERAELKAQGIQLESAPIGSMHGKPILAYAAVLDRKTGELTEW